MSSFQKRHKELLQSGNSIQKILIENLFMFVFDVLIATLAIFVLSSHVDHPEILQKSVFIVVFIDMCYIFFKIFKIVILYLSTKKSLKQYYDSTMDFSIYIQEPILKKYLETGEQNCNPGEILKEVHLIINKKKGRDLLNDLENYKHLLTKEYYQKIKTSTQG